VESLKVRPAHGLDSFRNGMYSCNHWALSSSLFAHWPKPIGRRLTCPNAKQSSYGGYHTEYSAMKLGSFLFAEYINMFISSAVISTVYFGGYNFPGIDPSWLWGLMGPVVIFAKTFFFIFVFMWIRWTLPRFRYDQLMHLGWKSLIPLSILNMLLTGAGILWLG
jgi:NADH-quinone oxidoreductase subunit H